MQDVRGKETLMIIFKEKEHLDEMSIRVISSPEEKLPFKVTIKCPDKGRLDHAHIMKLGTKSHELGAFVITKTLPRRVSDLVGYTEGDHTGLEKLTNEQLQALVLWASMRNSLLPAYTNWQTLQYEYAVNRRV
jgi:hypothetical protein